MFGATLVPGSGSGLHYKDDGTTGSDLDTLVPVRFEAKGTASGTYSMDPMLYVNLRDRAVHRGQLPFVAIRFNRGTPKQSDWVLVEDLFLSKEELAHVLPPSTEAATPRAGCVSLGYLSLQLYDRRGQSVRLHWDLDRVVRVGRVKHNIKEHLCLVVMRLETLVRIVNDRYLHSLPAP